MSDLIERLRDPNVIYMTREAAAEVADEIERLRAALERIWGEFPYEYGADIAREALSTQEVDDE